MAAIRTATSNEDIATFVLRSLAALLIAGCCSPACPQQASGRLAISGNLQASYYAEAASEQSLTIGQGTAEGGSLRLSVKPGPIAIRVLKANSGSKQYIVVVNAGEHTIRMPGLPYEATIPIRIPESISGLPLVLLVIPD
ncbi:hypothetical protein [Paludibaculum fermentans]|uniref:Uncharacterized protein n=1 Tax=Paludibaculum fermentans TaxID=1473598 RepID=A0A7S7NN28_PALFE|nr:hypothetical protein [Paludibaculum fermentans]QOY86569.1 hypothetical protein IRI77_27780 [Paludibaculum fermentans]